MNRTLVYSPVRWSFTSLGDICSKDAPHAFVEILDAFEVEHNAYCYSETDCYDFEVERESLKELRRILLSGDFTEEQDETYKACLNAMGVEHDHIINTLTQLLTVKTDSIRIAWS